MFSNIDLNFFYINKSFNFRISFNFDSIKYIIIRNRSKTVKVEEISDIMQRVLKYV